MYLNKLHERNPDLTVSTVYRILESFYNVGLLTLVHHPGSHKHYYDITVREHHHLFNGRCITDYDDPDLTALIRQYLESKDEAPTDIDSIQVQIIIK